MHFLRDTADFFIPDGADESAACTRVTHLGIGAHHDDLEFMAFHGIAAAHGDETRWFGGVTCTDGRGSARTGPYANFSDDEMREVRREEQRKAATIGEYSYVAQLDHPSHEVRGVRSDIATLLEATTPQVVYTHNPADKHQTHVGVCAAVIEALRALPAQRQPREVYGCEVWRDLDWLPDEDKVVLDVSGHEELATRLNAVFESQIAGGKRYDLAVAGRRRAHATFLSSHHVDAARSVIFAMDLTPLLRNPSLDLAAYTCGFVEKLRDQIADSLRRPLVR